MTDYALPVNSLLTLGRPTNVFGAWDDYSRFGFTHEHVSQLTRMIMDMDLNTADGDALEVWAPLHAWRALAAIEPVASLDAMLAIHKPVMDEVDSDQPGEDLHKLAPMIGGPALPSLERYLADFSMGEARTHICGTIAAIGMAHSDQRAFCITVLANQLDRCVKDDEAVNGFIVASLLDLKATEAVPAMERAFGANCVDDSIAGDSREVQYELGLIERPPHRDRNPVIISPRVVTVSRAERQGLKGKRKAQRQARKKNRNRR